MREIKFRIWDKNSRRWDNALLLDPSTGDLMYESLSNGITMAKGDDFETVQYTGLKDKNGVEIYEGDVLMAQLHSTTPTWAGKADRPIKRRKCLVYWENNVGAFRLGQILKTYIEYNMWDFSDINHSQFGNTEVIGNIYENPELIQK